MHIPFAFRGLALAAIFGLAASPTLAQNSTGGLMLEHRTLLRCSASFALVAHGQETGNADALGYPPLEEDGREYFVHAVAKVMDDTGMTREQVADELAREAAALLEGDRLREIMPACLVSLEDFMRP